MSVSSFITGRNSYKFLFYHIKATGRTPNYHNMWVKLSLKKSPELAKKINHEIFTEIL